MVPDDIATIVKALFRDLQFLQEVLACPHHFSFSVRYRLQDLPTRGTVGTSGSTSVDVTETDAGPQIGSASAPPVHRMGGTFKAIACY